MKRLRQFITDNALRLAAQLKAFEENVAVEADEIRESYEPIPAVVGGINGGVYTVGQAVEVDVTLAAREINLAPPNSGRRGWITVVRTAGANTLTMRPVRPATINGVASVTHASVATARVARVYFDGQAFYA